MLIVLPSETPRMGFDSLLSEDPGMDGGDGGVIYNNMWRGSTGTVIS